MGGDGGGKWMGRGGEAGLLHASAASNGHSVQSSLKGSLRCTESFTNLSVLIPTVVIRAVEGGGGAGSWRRAGGWRERWRAASVAGGVNVT